MMTRRGFLKLLLGAFASGVGFASYAFGVEPLLRLRIERKRITPKQWPAGLAVKLAVVADLHACRPWMDEPRIRAIVDQTNALGADAIILMGDYMGTHGFRSGDVPAKNWAFELGRLAAPLGVHAVLGNHDWWHDAQAQARRKGPIMARRALEAVNIPVYENDVQRLEKNGQGFWLLGLGDQIALLPPKGAAKWAYTGVDDLPATLNKVTDDAPVVLLAHEPDIFPKVPDRVSLTICGHTHGGQVRIFGYSPVVPSSYGNRFAYGHVEENGRHLVVSGGLGCSIMPVRFGVPPEITLIELANKDDAV